MREEVIPSQKRSRVGVMMITPFFRPNVGGVETHLDDLCSYLTGREHRIFIATLQPLSGCAQGESIENQESVLIRRVGWIGSGWFDALESKPVLVLAYLIPPVLYASLSMLLRHRKEIKVIHAHGIIASVAARLLMPMIRTRFISSIHTLYFLGDKPLLARALCLTLSKFDKVLFMSKSAQEEFVRVGFPRSKAKIFTYWANGSRFRPIDKSEAKSRLGLDANFTVLFVGRLIREKGVDLFAEIARRVPEASFLAITTGTKKDFRKFVGPSWPTNLRYIGPVEYDKLANYYAAADLFVLPSQSREGFPRAAVEAALCGTYSLVSDVGSVRDVFEGGIIGEVIDPPTPNNFSNKVRFYLDHRDFLARSSTEIAATASTRFNQSNASMIEFCYSDDQ